MLLLFESGSNMLFRMVTNRLLAFCIARFLYGSKCTFIVCVLLFQDSKTKSGIEAKMTELNHRMSIEHRNRRKSHEYYRKLVEATKVGSKGRWLLYWLLSYFVICIWHNNLSLLNSSEFIKMCWVFLTVYLNTQSQWNMGVQVIFYSSFLKGKLELVRLSLMNIHV